MYRLAVLRERIARRLDRFLGWKRMRNVEGIRFPDDLHTRGIYAFACYDSFEIPLMVLMRKILRPGSVFIDVGANIGYVSAAAMRLVSGSGKVVAFEPVARYYEHVRRIGLLNPGFDLTVENLALGAANGTARIAISGNGNIGWNTMVPGFMTDQEPEVEAVMVVTLDEYAAGRGLERIDLVKIDVEGFELHVLTGMSRIIRESRPVIYLEYAPRAQGLMGVGADDMDAMLVAARYQIYEAQSMSPLRLGTLSQTTNLVLMPVEIR